MKLFNIFKKETKTAKANIQKMDKTQLEKVIGGTDIIETTLSRGGKEVDKLKEEIKKL